MSRSGTESAPATRRGLHLFPGQNSPSYRRRRLVFAAVYAAVIVALTVPVVPAVWTLDPRLLGLPTSFAWVILNLAVIMIALVWLFLGDSE